MLSMRTAYLSLQFVPNEYTFRRKALSDIQTKTLCKYALTEQKHKVWQCTHVYKR